MDRLLWMVPIAVVLAGPSLIGAAQSTLPDRVAVLPVAPLAPALAELAQLPGIVLDVATFQPLALANTTMPRHMRGTLYLGASDIDPSGQEPGLLAVGLEASGAFNSATPFSLSFIHGPADIVSPLTISGLRRPTARAVVKRPTWLLTAGDFTSAQHAIAGPVVRADGVHLQVNRPWFAELSVGRPKYFGGGGGGHLLQGRAGLKTRIATLAVVASELQRPPHDSIISVRVVQPQSAEEAGELDDLRRVTSRENHVRGVGIEGDLRAGKHSLTVRAGLLALESQSGLRSRGTAAEARYAFTLGRGSLGAYARHAPPSVPGTYVPGDALSLVGRLPIGRLLSATAQGYSNTSWLVGQPRPVRADGVSAGVQHGKGRETLSLQANYRELRSAAVPQFTRSVTLRFTRPLRLLEVDVRAELGENQRGPIVRPLRTYQTRVTVGGEQASVWFMGSFNDSGFYMARTRADVGGDFQIGSSRVEVGTGYGRGQILGDTLTAWGTIEVPLPTGIAFVAGVDYVRWNYEASRYLTFALEEEGLSPWRINLGLKRAFGRSAPTRRADSVPMR